MEFTDAEYEKMLKKLEYTFKKSGSYLVDKIANKEDLTDGDLKLLIRKLEYRFRKSGDELVQKLAEMTEEPAVKYSNLKARRKKLEK